MIFCRPVLAALLLLLAIAAGGCVAGPDDMRVQLARIVLPSGTGPEHLLQLDATTLVTGLADGRVVLVNVATGEMRELANTGGRPLGIARHPSGALVIADAHKGVLWWEAGELRPLLTELNGEPLRFPNGVDVSLSGKIYFTDSSRLYDHAGMTVAAITADATGRLIELDPDTGETRVLLDDLVFGNGVALSRDGGVLYVAETFAYRIRAYRLRGEEAGRWSVFAEDLPGFPDNLSVDEDDNVWVALYADRVAALEALQRLAPLSRLVSSVLDSPLRSIGTTGPGGGGRIVMIEDDGDVEWLLRPRDDAGGYADLTSVLFDDDEDTIYLGSAHERAIGIAPEP